MIKNFLNPEGHQNSISGSKVTAILQKGWIWPIGEASVGEGLRLQPAQQAFFLSSYIFKFVTLGKTASHSGILEYLITPLKKEYVY